jgi:hypothetical protein
VALSRILAGFDPLVRLLVLAIVLASVVPVGAEHRPAAQAVSNAAIFLLFLLNGLRLPRAEVVRGIGNFRFLVPLVAWCFGAMALAGWGLSLLVAPWLPPLVVLGFVVLAQRVEREGRSLGKREVAANGGGGAKMRERHARLSREQEDVARQHVDVG